MASTFHGGIPFHMPKRDLRQPERLSGTSLKLTYRLSECTMKIDDQVAGGALVGSLNGRPLRAGLSGRVCALSTDNEGILLSIESNGQAHSAEAVSFGKRTGKTLSEAEPDLLLAEIEASGIVEQSGEALADHLKRAMAYAPGKLRLAAAACLDLDPLSLTNVSITEEKADAVAGGLTILLRLLKLREGTMVCDSRYKESIQAAEDACADSTLIAIEAINNRYPQASVRLLTRHLTDRELSASRVPEDAGLFLTDAETCASLYRLFAEGSPEPFKRLSIFTDGLLKIYDLPIGLSLSTLTEMDILPELPEGWTLCRGAMDGRALPEWVDATLNVLAVLPTDGDEASLLLSADKEAAEQTKDTAERSPVTKLLSILPSAGYGCIACGRCASVCPIYLMPYDYLPKSRLQRWLSGSPKDAAACMGCGCCSYICPARLPLRSAVQSAARKETHNGN